MPFLGDDVFLDLTVLIADLSPALSETSKVLADVLRGHSLRGASLVCLPRRLEALIGFFSGLAELMRVFLLVISARVGGPMEGDT